MSRFSSAQIHGSPEKGLHDLGNHFDINSLPDGLEFSSNAGGLHSIKHAEYLYQRDLRFRKPSLTYYNSGLRDSPDGRTAQKCYKAFVTIIPPPILLQETNQLGHILSTGPAHRASQGLVMPLFPTIYGQLTAIAREFGFPSTAGLCLYLQLTENGIQFSPRISDDCWQMFWSHMFEGSNINQTRGLQMGGRVEFDIDLRQARWFTSWVTSLRKGTVNMSTPSPSAHIPATRSSGDSKTIVPEDFSAEGVFSIPPVQQHNTSSVSRHTPKKLSLVDKTNSHLRADFVMNYDQLHPLIKTSDKCPPENPRIQPKLAHELDSRVRTWRDSASNELSKIESGQPSVIDNCPSEPLQNALLKEQNIDFNDYSWSATSEGTRDDNRTPAFSHPHVLTPDIAQRMYDDAPLTPLTATTWGPPSSYPLSPGLTYYRTPSIDLGQRHVFSRPVTPATASSWGPSDWTPAPLLSTYSYRRPSIDLGQRNVFSRPLTPATATSWGPCDMTPSASPFSDISFQSIHMADRGDFSRPLTPLSQQDKTDFNSDIFWRQGLESESMPKVIVTLTPPYPALIIYNTIYPWNLEDIYPATDMGVTSFALPIPRNENKDWSTPMSVHITSYPSLHIYPLVYPSSSDFVCTEPPILGGEEKHDSHSLTRGYPYLDLYSPVYPHFDLYPDLSGGHATILDQDISRTFSNYPDFDLYPAIYRFKFDPGVTIQQKISKQQYRHKEALGYPIFDLYPAMCPHFNLCPVAIEHKKSHQAVNGYPNFDLHPAIYPYFDLYPALAIGHTTIPGQRLSHEVVLGYPNFDLYPAVAVIHNQHYMNSQFSGYPYFDLYPSAYPHLPLYPPITPGHDKVCEGESASNTAFTSRISTSHPRLSSYPVFDLFSPIYPYFCLFPQLAEYETTNLPLKDNSLQSTDQHYGQSWSNQSLTGANSLVEYPMFNIYPPIYPHLEIYPQAQMNPSSLIPNPSPSYPTFNLYPAINSYFSQYPSTAGRMDLSEPQPLIESFSVIHPRVQADLPVPQLNASRLTHSELHAMVMMENNISTIIGTQRSRQKPFGKNYQQLPILRSRNQPTLPRASPLTPSRHLPAPPSSAPQPSSAFDLMSSFTNEVLSNSKRRSFIHKPSSGFRNGFRESVKSSDTSDISP